MALRGLRRETDEKPIFFFGSANANGYLSQMFISPFQKQGVWYNCNEQFFQAAKADWFQDKEQYKRIMDETDPKIQKKLGKKVKGFNKDYWNTIAYRLVLRATELKFTESEHADELQEKLLATGDRPLAEAAPHDLIWGIGMGVQQATKHVGHWPGRNLLGKALEQTRTKLRDAARLQTEIEGAARLEEEAAAGMSPADTDISDLESELDPVPAPDFEIEPEIEIEPEPEPEVQPEHESDAAPEPQPPTAYHKLKVPELKAKAKERGLSGFSDKRKPELVKMLEDADRPPRKRRRTVGPPQPDEVQDLSYLTHEELVSILEKYGEYDNNVEDPETLRSRCHETILEQEYNMTGKRYDEWPTEYLALELKNRSWGRAFSKTDRATIIDLLRANDVWQYRFTDTMRLPR